MRAYQASATLRRHTWEEYETPGQVLASPREWGPEGLENRGSVWSPGGRCWLWVVWKVISLKNTCCHLVVWNRLPCNYLGPEVHVQLGGIADSFSECMCLVKEDGLIHFLDWTRSRIGTFCCIHPKTKPLIYSYLYFMSVSFLSHVFVKILAI